MLQSSQVWLDGAAGRIQPERRTWAKQDAAIALKQVDFHVLPMQVWLDRSDREQLRLLRAAVALEAA